MIGVIMIEINSLYHEFNLFPFKIARSAINSFSGLTEISALVSSKINNLWENKYLLEIAQTFKQINVKRSYVYLGVSFTAIIIAYVFVRIIIKSKIAMKHEPVPEINKSHSKVSEEKKGANQEESAQDEDIPPAPPLPDFEASKKTALKQVSSVKSESEKKKNNTRTLSLSPKTLEKRKSGLKKTKTFANGDNKPKGLVPETKPNIFEDQLRKLKKTTTGTKGTNQVENAQDENMPPLSPLSDSEALNKTAPLQVRKSESERKKNNAYSFPLTPKTLKNGLNNLRKANTFANDDKPTNLIQETKSGIFENRNKDPKQSKNSTSVHVFRESISREMEKRRLSIEVEEVEDQPSAENNDDVSGWD